MTNRQYKLTIFTVALCLILALGGALTSAQTPDSRPLTTGQVIERELKGDEDHSYTLALTAGQYLDVVVEQKGIDVIVALFDANGKKVAEVDSPNGRQGAEPLAVIVETAGNYRLEIRSLEKTVPAGRYEVKIKELRAPTEKDKNKIAANKAFSEAEMLRQKGTAESLRNAIKKYEESFPWFLSNGDQEKAAAALNQIGFVYSRLGDKRQALKFYNEALLLFRAVDDKGGEVATLNNIGGVYADLGEKQKALEYYEQSLLLYRAVSDKSGEATTLINIGAVYFDLGEKQKALEYFSQSLPLFRAVGDKRFEAITLTNIGAVYSDLGEKQKALEYYAQSLPLFRADGDKGGEAATLTNIGAVYADLGEKQKALEYFSQSLLLTRADGDKGGEATTLSHIGAVYSALGEKQKALKYYEQSLLLYRAVSDKSGEATTLTNIGAVYSALGEKQKALEYFSQSLPLFRAVGDKRFEAITLTHIGTVYSDLGEKQKALEYYAQSLPLLRAVGDKRFEAITLDHLFYQLASDDPRFGVFYGKLSVNNYQILRSNVQGLDKNIQQTFLKSVESTYRGLVDKLLEQKRYPEAQQVLNNFKDQQFFDFSQNKSFSPLAATVRETELTAGLNGKLETIVAAIRAADDFRRGIGGRELTVAESAKLKTLENAEAAANTDYLAFLESARKQFAAPPDEKDETPAVADLQAMQTILRQMSAQTNSPTVAVYTLVGVDNYRALIVTGDSISSVSTPIKGAALNQKAQQLWWFLHQSKYDPQPLAREVYDVVFAPLAGKLPADTKTILWSLDGSLRYVPMAALHDGKQYLVERYNNVVFTRADRERLTRNVSANLTGTGFGSSRRHIVKLGSESFEFPPLVYVKPELDGIFKNSSSTTGVVTGETMLDAQFTRATMISTLKKRRPLVHIASHFKFAPGDEANSFLLLGDGTAFTLDEMKRQKDLFAGVELLALSACETAAQQKDSNGREVDGFAELAQRLGAGAVMASLWAVRDDSTAELMARFYKNYNGQKGANKASALRSAQIALLRGEYITAGAANRQLTRKDAETAEKFKIDLTKQKLFNDAKNPKYAHPFFWSPFILIGNWK